MLHHCHLLRSIVLLAFLVFPSLVHAQAIVDLPLDGYYRPGKFFPVVITADHPVTVQIDVEDGIGSRAQGTAITLPVMLLNSRSRSLRISIDGQPVDRPIQPLEANQRLALVDSPEAAAVTGSIFPGQMAVPVVHAIDRAAVIDIAYESADVVLRRNLGEEDAKAAALAGFAGAGPPLAVPVTPITATWPIFAPRGGAMVFYIAPRGPTSSLPNQAAFDALTGLTAGRTPMIRRTVWLAMALFSLLILSATLLGKRGIIGVVLIALLTISIAAIYFARQSPVTEWRGDIRLRSPAIEQHDEWAVRTSVADVAEVIDTGTRSTRPIFETAADAAGWTLDVTPAGWSYHGTLHRGQTIAWLTRRWDQPPAPSPDHASPTDHQMLAELAKAVYCRPGERVEMSLIERNTAIVGRR